MKSTETVPSNPIKIQEEFYKLIYKILRNERLPYGF
jgi:hypothetical protein